MKLFQVDTLEQARQKLLDCFKAKEPTTQLTELCDAQGKILARDIFSKEDIPSFYRSTVDGYGVIAKDTQGANDSVPTFLEIVEDIAIGTQSKRTLVSGECAYVPTGGMLPQGADAMVMVEFAEAFDDSHIAVYQSVAVGKSVVVPGEDIKQGEPVLKKGTRLEAAEIGALAAAGFWTVETFCPFKVAIISTGDELADVQETPEAGRVRDVNTWTLKAIAQQVGMDVVMTKKLRDDEELLKQTIKNAMEISDIVLTSGGSSQGKKDMTSQILDELASPGVFTHGLSVKPGKPTILALDEETHTLLVGLPGHPVAALSVFQMLLVWLWKERTYQEPQSPIMAKMATNAAGAPGKTTCLLVELVQGQDGYMAKPILGKSGLINTMTKADGYVEIEMNKEGLQNGETVQVYRFGL
ncbi:MAG: molybdopterin molybdotransferase MoeA [Oscillospiraceae bacterium]